MNYQLRILPDAPRIVNSASLFKITLILAVTATDCFDAKIGLL